MPESVDSAPTTFSQLSPAARAIWAKSGEGSGHGLLAHMLDVAAVAQRIWQGTPRPFKRKIAARMGLPHAHAGRWIATLVGLHDFGKAIPGFYAKWPEAMAASRAAALQFNDRSLHVTNHSCATAALLAPALRKLVDAESIWLLHAIGAISAHHGYHFSSTEIAAAKPLREDKVWSEARFELLAAYWRVMAPQGRPVSDELDLPTVNWLAGLTSVADWIGSNVDWFAMGERHDDLLQYFGHALELAETALACVPWPSSRTFLPVEASTDELICRIIGVDSQVSARPLQHAGELLLSKAQGPALMLVEAPMGEGKTELALLACLRLQTLNDHRGLFMALPTQATGNAMFKRVVGFLQRFAQADTDIQLVHGGALLNEDMQNLRDVDHSRGETVSAAAWFTPRRRPLLSPHGVGTIDQALFGVLNVKHHFVRLFGLSNRVVVLDEVHAYDTYTSGLIECLLRWLKALGCSVVLMSATLPRHRRDALLQAWNIPNEESPELPYPRVLVASGSGVYAETFAARPLPPVTVSGLSEDLAEIALLSMRQVEHGGCGLVVANTVERAQALYRLLEGQLDNDSSLMLFHARYPAEQRTSIEQAVLAAFGAHGQRPAKAILIATQVAEQSLDVDFDFVITDLAPVDLLLQRVGRLHRHERIRPDSHSVPRVHVAGLGGKQLPELKETAWEYVYDPYILGRTWAILSRMNSVELPEDIDRLVQQVYGDHELPEDLEAQARAFIEIESYGKYRARVTRERQQWLNISIDPSEEPQAAYVGKPRGADEDELLGQVNQTRLGRESVTLVPVHVAADGWCIEPYGECFDPNAPVSDDLAKRLYARHVRVSGKACVAHFSAQPIPVAFEMHALLQNFHPLVLRDGWYSSQDLTLGLHETLGLLQANDTRLADDTHAQTLQPA
ncbi:CRISPR-associated helicase Cas3' [Bordetella genomosp. 13]|uniref:CRISPR-associated helicase Cas3' n=1 Tax=Bordetella genomosp. 13 TaxID=463040 RepID=UPI0018DFD0D1|nr:CRISPR-associated helicase Cas3' [Bordetella genomosp. 13]